MTDLLTNAEVLAFIGSFFIIFREGLEAMLIVMLVFSYLEILNVRDKNRYVWYGVFSGILLSILVATGFSVIAEATHEHEELFEGITMIIAALMLFYVAWWCHGPEQHIKHGIEQNVSTGTALALSATVMFAILREGFEIVLFYNALFLSDIEQSDVIITGGVAALVALFILYIILKRVMLQIPVKLFFTISKFAMIFLGIYFLWQGWQELEEVFFHTVNPSDMPDWYCKIRPMVCYH